jgi:hypothetical protein
VGRLLGDPEVWDDRPSRPRVLLRGVVGLAAGLAAGGLLALVLAPRPAPPPPRLAAPARPALEAPGVRVDQQALGDITLSAGPVLVTRSGRLELVKPDGSGRRVLAQSVRASAVVGPGRDGALVALDGGQLLRVGSDGATMRLGPSGFVAGGLAGRGGRLLACADADGRRPPGRALLLSAGGGPASRVGLGCPVAWAADAQLVAGTGGPWRPTRRGVRGSSVLLGRPGVRPRPLLDAGRLRAAAGAGATVGALALSPDGRLAAVAAGSSGRPWMVLVLDAGGHEVARIPLADGHEAAWLGWADRQGTATLGVAAVDRRRGLAGATLAGRQAGGYVLAWDARTRTAAVLAGGVPMVAADGFAWSPDGETVGISSPRGLTLVLKVAVVRTTAAPVAGTLVAWPGGTVE